MFAAIMPLLVLALAPPTVPPLGESAQEDDKAVVAVLDIANRDLRRNRYSSALQNFQNVLKLADNHPEALWGLARCQEKLGKKKDAVSSLRLLVKILGTDKASLSRRKQTIYEEAQEKLERLDELTARLERVLEDTAAELSAIAKDAMADADKEVAERALMLLRKLAPDSERVSEIEALLLRADAVQWNGSSYLVIARPATFEEASRACARLGGHLVSIGSSEENTLVVGLIQRMQSPGKHQHCWLGASDEKEEGNWQWLDGSKFRFSDWHGAEPNGGDRENGLVLSVPPPGDSWGPNWGDYPLDQLAWFCCEWKD